MARACKEGMLWLYLLGLVTFLTIVVRRLVRRQKPLSDELYLKTLAIDHVHDGVAWVRADGRIGYANPSLARMAGTPADELKNRTWFHMFTPEERTRMEDAYAQMLLAGRASFEANLVNSQGEVTRRNLLLVAVHDHKTRFAGHHCIVENRVVVTDAQERFEFAMRD